MPSGARAEIHYARIRTRIGDLFAAVSPRGVCRISLRERSERAFVDDLTTRTGARPVRDADRLRPVEKELRAYFRGTLRRFSLRVDLTPLTSFQRSVLRATSKVPFGCVTTYGAVASRIGKARASRAVGNALGANPVPILVPCHRVVASDGSLGGFTGGLGLKRALLRVEGVAV